MVPTTSLLLRAAAACPTRIVRTSAPRRPRRHESTSATTTTTPSCCPISHATGILQQKLYLLGAISDADYIRPVLPPTAFSSSSSSPSSPSSPSSSSSSSVPPLSSTVGMHIRHSLDHYASVCAAIGSPHLNVPAVLKYDERSRDAETECNRKKATELCERCVFCLLEVVPHLTRVRHPGSSPRSAAPTSRSR